MIEYPDRDDTMMRGVLRPAPRAAHNLLRSGAQLAAVWAFGVSQPVFSLLHENPEFLVARSSTRVEVILFAFLLAFGPPLVAVALEWLVYRASSRVGEAVHLAFLAVFFVPAALAIAKVFDPSTAYAGLMVSAICAAAGAAYWYWRAVRLFLTVAVALPIVGFAWFVLGIPLATDDAQAARITVASRNPVVFIVLDEFPVSSLLTRSGQIDAIRYPSFARLARQATWYRNATTVHWHTTAAVPAILTGRLPRKGELPRLADHPWNLFTLLAGTYALRVHEEVTHLCPTTYCPRADGSIVERLDGLFEDVGVAYFHMVLPSSAAGGLPSIDDRWGRFVQQGELLEARDAGDIDEVFGRFLFPKGDAFERFLTELARGRQPGLNFIHMLLPHVPWRFLPSGRQYGFEQAIEGFNGRDGRWDDDSWLVQQAFQRHLLQVEYTDRVLGRTLRQLERSGLYDRALLVVVADHGASFRPGGLRRDVDEENLADIAGIPMFVKYPGQQRGGVDPRWARTIDLVPTIADVLGIRLPWKVDGRSLLASPSELSEVSVSRRDGTLVRASLENVQRGIEATIRRKAALFGEGHDSLYRIGANQQLLGSAVGTEWVSSATVRVGIEDADRLADVRRSSSFVPARISGIVEEGRVDSGQEVAVAVNGRIRSLTRCFLDAGEQRFRALVPESAFNEGFNRVEVFAVSGKGSRLRLVKLGESGPPR